MSTVELDIKKARLARRILNEKNASFIDALDENYNKLQQEAGNATYRNKLAADFWDVIEKMRRPDPDFKFDREDCYDRCNMTKK
ncbi:MAG: hypothetical protein LBQ28_03995 [Prevotellaceae bacterium]|jgi:hypothetical protein|nr:hypothetical protein [Prevotellaceae bacterium]